MIWACLRLPWTARSALMGKIIEHVVAPLAGYRKRAIANLDHVWPDMPDAEKLRIANAVSNNAGRTMIENYDVAGLRHRMHGTPVHGPGLKIAQEARDAGTPVLFVTGHFGNFEAPRAALVARGFQIGGLYRPMTNSYFNDHYAENMHALSGPVFAQGRRGTMGLLKHIRQGGMGVLLFDIYDSTGEIMDFMGKPAPTVTSAAEIALKTGALLIPFFGRRLPNGVDFDITFEEPIEHGDPIDMTKEMSKRLEAQVTQYPEQWFWIHRRWKPRRQRRRAAANMGP